MDILEATMTTDIVVKRMRRSMRWALVAAVLSTCVPILVYLRGAEPLTLIVTTASALLLWGTFMLQWRAFLVAFNHSPTDDR